MTRHIFFSGKGGVGKTTMASATAVHHAIEGKKTLIVTTDPASNLADVFEQEIGHKVVPVKGVPGLSAMEIDPDEAAKEYKERIIGPYREIMPDDVIASLEENLSGPCTTEMASFDRFIDFMESDEYDVIVFDTAPTGHTIRLLELPVDWSKHIEESARGSGQTCLGPVETIQDSKEKYDRAAALLRDRDRTAFVFVMRPEELSLYETLRASKELKTIGIESGGLIINGILPEDVCEAGFFRKKWERQQDVIRETEKAIGWPRHFMLLRDNEVKGTDALRDVAEELFAGKRPKPGRDRSPEESFTSENESESEKPDMDALMLPGKGTKAFFFTGKGGVGKTTISCMAALRASAKGLKTLLVTTDPAAHIGEVLGVHVGSEPVPVAENLKAVTVDQEAAFKEYKERVLNEAAGKYSDDMLAAMEEELNSPCTEEMAAFDKFVRFIENNDYDVVVFDTAPTGHTLRLLDLPFDYAKQVEMMIGADEAKEAERNRFREIIETIRDRKRAVFSLVLYPESTPILESYRAMLDLKQAGIEIQFIVANMLLPEASCTNDFFAERRRMQMKYLKKIAGLFRLPVLQVPLMGDELMGIASLKTAGSVIMAGNEA